MANIPKATIAQIARWRDEFNKEVSDSKVNALVVLTQQQSEKKSPQMKNHVRFLVSCKALGFTWSESSKWQTHSICDVKFWNYFLTEFYLRMYFNPGKVAAGQ